MNARLGAYNDRMSLCSPSIIYEANLHTNIPYKIEETCERENFCELVKNTIFAKKTYVNSHKSTKFVKVFSIVIFSLYSHCCITTQLTCALINRAYRPDPI